MAVTSDSQARQRSQQDESTPILTINGSRADIRLNRPNVHNRLHPEDIIQLLEMFAEINDNPDIRVLVITGTGEKVFSSGFHLGELQRVRNGQDEPAPETNAPAAPNFGAMTLALENLRVPTICRLNGSVYGGATDLAVSCDFRIGVRGTEMFMPAARLGLHYYPEGLVRWSHRLGTEAARRLFLTATRITADQMHRIGYLTELVDRDALDGTVDEWADNLMAMAPQATQDMKRSLNEIAHGNYDRDVIARRSATSLASEDIREGLAAWHEKRPPVFTGR